MIFKLLDSYLFILSATIQLAPDKTRPCLWAGSACEVDSVANWVKDFSLSQQYKPVFSALGYRTSHSEFLF